MQQESLFGASYDSRFLDKFLGNMAKDPVIAITELIANAYDAGAQNVYIKWPLPKEVNNPKFEISDDGRGLLLQEFQEIWGKLNYDRMVNQGDTVFIYNANGEVIEKRFVYGKNGKGRLSCFCFNDKYVVKSYRNNQSFECEVARSDTESTPFILTPSAVFKTEHKNGLTISSDIKNKNSLLDIEELKKEISARFIGRPTFKISINGSLLTLQDIPKECILEKTVEFNGYEIILRLIDTNKIDQSTKQRGVAWWVQNRIVGDINWSFLKNYSEFDQRSSTAKKFNLIIEANCLHTLNLVLPDWSGFDTQNKVWGEFEDVMIPAIKELMSESKNKESKHKANNVLRKVRHESKNLSSLSNTKIINFVDETIDKCPSLNQNTLYNLAQILIKLEKSSGKYNLIQKLSSYSTQDLDNLYSILDDWGVDMAKVVLDEIQGRLKTIAEFKLKMDVLKIDEVHELQVLFNNSLWMFGPQFESIEYTSNKGMTHALKHLFKADNIKGSLNRPDFLILPDSSIGFYARPSYDEEFEPRGIAHLIIVDLKTTGLKLGTTELNQVWKYATELMSKGVITPDTRVHGFVLGDCIAPHESNPMERGNVKITPILYSDLLKRAEKRMLGLFNNVKEAPFIKEHIQKEQQRITEIYENTPELAY